MWFAVTLITTGCDDVLGLKELEPPAGGSWACAPPSLSTWTETTFTLIDNNQRVVTKLGHPTLDLDNLLLYMAIAGDLWRADVSADLTGAIGDRLDVTLSDPALVESSPSLYPNDLMMLYDRGTSVVTATYEPSSGSWSTAVSANFPMELTPVQVGTPALTTAHGTRVVVSSVLGADLHELVYSDVDAQWTEVPTLAKVNDPSFADVDPYLSRDGCSLLFASNRLADYDLYLAVRASDGSFAAPSRVAVSTTGADERGPAMPRDGSLMLFTRDDVLRRAAP